MNRCDPHRRHHGSAHFNHFLDMIRRNIRNIRIIGQPQGGSQD
jgi:hypothetical protein